jgi:hypothetical protein
MHESEMAEKEAQVSRFRQELDMVIMELHKYKTQSLSRAGQQARASVSSSLPAFAR